MTKARKLKQTIRSRAAKTGESYAAARRQVLAARDRKAAPAAPKPVPATPAAGPVRGALSDEKSRERTGRGLDHWFAVLDAFGAVQKGHTAAARYLNADHGVNGWHAQGITVAYERARGLRAVNQRCFGDFEVSVSRVVPASKSGVAAALKAAQRRAIWLADAPPDIARALRAALDGSGSKGLKKHTNGDLGLRYKSGDARVEWRLVGATGKTSVVVALTKLADAAAVEAQRAGWKAALDGLRRHLAG